MNVTMDLLHVVEQAHSLARILEGATRVVAERLGVAGCFVFLLDEHGDLVRSAAGGPDPAGPRGDAEVESIAAQVFAENGAQRIGRPRHLRLVPRPRMRLDIAHQRPQIARERP